MLPRDSSIIRAARSGCIGVTGTNGKTSVTHFAAALLAAASATRGIRRNAGLGIRGQTLPGGSHHRRCRDRCSGGSPVSLRPAREWVAMEASSHALDQGRVDDVAYDIAVFTNLTRDHLDYHGTMERYAAAKRRLFEWPTLHGGVVNWDDPQGRMIYRERSARMNLLRFGSTAGCRLAVVRSDVRRRGHCRRC